MDIAVFPELSITGYPPEDLLLKTAFIDENIRYLKKLKKITSDIIAIVGFVNKEHNQIYNSAAVLYNNEIRAIYNKQFLPNYSVFDEERYFKKGSINYIFKIAGTLIGINICEDIFHPSGPTRIQSIIGGAELIINISASPYHTEKVRERDVFGSSWRGIAMPFTRLYFGLDPRAKKDLIDSGFDAQKLEQIMDNYQAKVIYDGMPVKDAVEFVKFILRTTIGLSSFEIGAPSCSEPICIAKISQKGEFEFLENI